ncbi:MAG TPA: DUF4352 domain-containing protein [Candidatus Woesebacteria bacterium]|nr:DUF4352 domain-containing protein [Candidatus Woesebacteria bacterium]
MKKLLKWGGIALLVIIVIGVFSSMGSDSEKVGSNSDNTQASNTDTQPSQEAYKVGDKVQMGDVILTVNNVETSEGGQYTNPSEGNHWIDINMTIENTGSDQEFITTMGQMFVIDGENNQYQVAVTGKRLENSGSLGMDGALVAKAKKTDWVGFEVPKTATGLKLQYNASFYSNKNILVDLGM